MMATPATEVQTIEKRFGVWITAHHAVLYVLLGIALLSGVYLFESKYAAIETARANQAEQALAIEKDHSTQLTNLFAANQAQRDKDNAAFLLTIAQTQSQAKIQIVHDKALPAPDLGHRIETITGFKQGTVTLDSSQDLIIPLPLGQGIVALLDQGSADAQTVIQQQGIIKNQVATITDLNSIVVEDKKVLAAQIDTDAKVLKAEKAKNRKSLFKWVIGAYVAGYLTRTLTKP
jgi:hypothetical protein